jgi:hypothetical protein
MAYKIYTGYTIDGEWLGSIRAPSVPEAKRRFSENFGLRMQEIGKVFIASQLRTALARDRRGRNGDSGGDALAPMGACKGGQI